MYNIMITEKFENDIKYYKKKKKYKNIDKDIQTVIGKLALGDLVGTQIPRFKFER